MAKYVGHNFSMPPCFTIIIAIIASFYSETVVSFYIIALINVIGNT